MVGGDMRIGLDASTSVGGAGWVLVTPSEIDGEVTGSELQLAIAYGGVLVERRLTGPGTVGLGLRLLLGAGNAKVSLPVVDTEIAVDNFGVIEPELVGAWNSTRWLQLRGQIGYRFVYGVEDLPQVGPRDLRGATLTFLASLGPR